MTISPASASPQKIDRIRKPPNAHCIGGFFFFLIEISGSETVFQNSDRVSLSFLVKIVQESGQFLRH